MADDSKLAKLLMDLSQRSDLSVDYPKKPGPTKFQRKAALRANNLAWSMNLPMNERYKQQTMEIPGEGGVSGRYGVPGRLPGMERLINALTLAESTMQRNRGERERPEGLPALHHGTWSPPLRR